MSPEPISECPPPWDLRGDVYSFPFYTSKPKSQSSSTAPDLAPITYSPLERQSPFADPATSQPVGGLSLIQIIRYSSTPVGPYDELVIVPGYFEYKREIDGNAVKKRGLKVSRIYVSTKETCYAGRKNWNIPKHLAEFTWKTHDDGRTSVAVYPLDTSPPPGSQPRRAFFRASFKPLRFAPAIPFCVQWMDRLGFSTTLTQPPLPSGPSPDSSSGGTAQRDGGQGELPGTNRWVRVVPEQSCRRAVAGWFDLSQDRLEAEARRDQESSGGAGDGAAKADSGDGNGNVIEEERYENFWPGLGRWNFGVKMEDAKLRFDVPLDEWEA